VGSDTLAPARGWRARQPDDRFRRVMRVSAIATLGGARDGRQLVKPQRISGRGCRCWENRCGRPAHRSPPVSY